MAGYDMFGSADAMMQMERERMLAAQALAGGGGGAAGAAMGAPTGMNPAGGSNLVNQQIAAAQQQQQPGMSPQQIQALRQGMSLMGNMRSSPQQAPAMPAANFAGTASGQVPGMPMGNIMQAMQALYGGRGGIG
jgi:hypothetical protein